MITIQSLQENIRITRAQERKNLDDANACAGAAQAYEALLSQLIQGMREESRKLKPAEIPTEIPENVPA